MAEEYEVELDELTIERDAIGKVTRHPLGGPYYYPKEGPTTYGYLTFAGHDLDKSPFMGDVRVFFLMFYGEPDSVIDREAWADPLRVEVLQRLTAPGRAWYFGIIPRLLDSNNYADPAPFERETDDWRALIVSHQAEHAIVQSEIADAYGGTFHPRLFFEVPNDSLANVVTHYWPEAIPGHPIEGYNMCAGQIDLPRKWNERPRDDRLFREVMDHVFVAFYTFPSEHRHFAFVTNKLDLEQLGRLIDIQSLKQQAKGIGERAGYVFRRSQLGP